MKREEVLKHLQFTVPANKHKRVILISDIHCEADDPFAIVQHLLTPSSDVKGIVACHYEWQARMLEEQTKENPELADAINAMPAEMKQFSPERGASRDLSYEEGKQILELAGIDDVPLLHGARYELSGRKDLPESEGADFIIEEAMREDDRPLYVCTLGAQTDLAIALLKKPEIAEKIIAVCIVGGEYPDGGMEFNCIQDVEAVNVILESACEFWQIPASVYRNTEVSFAELVAKVRPCGELGKWMVDQMFQFQQVITQFSTESFPNPEVWSIGDNPTAAVLLQSEGRICWHKIKAPKINPDGTYARNPNGKEIRVYDWIDNRLTIHDLFAKLSLCYGRGV